MSVDAEGQEPRESTGGRRMHRFFRDLSVTLVAQACVAVGGLLLARLLATETGAEGFASYSLVKQAANFLFPVVTVGLVGGLPRYLALPREGSSPTGESYLAAAAAIAGAATLLACVLASVTPAGTAGLFFGDSGRTELVAPFVLLLAATTAFYVAYGYFRGQLRLRAGGALQVLGLAALPPALVVALPDEPVSTLITLMAVGLAALSLLSIIVPLVRGVVAGPHRRRVRSAAHSLWHYGHRRVPGELAQLGIFVLVPILAAHVASLTDVAYLSAGQQVLSIVSIAVLPLGLVLLPSLTAMWARDREQASGYVGRLAALAVHVAIFAGIQTVLFADLAVRLWLGPEFNEAGSVVRVATAPVAAFAVYLMLRSALDAVAVKSYNSRNNLIALAIFGAVAAVLLAGGVTRPGMAVALAFAAGIVAQGALTLATVHSLFGLRSGDYSLGAAGTLGLATGVAGLAARPLIEDAGVALLLLAVLQGVLAVAYFAALFYLRVGWSRLLRERLFERQE